MSLTLTLQNHFITNNAYRARRLGLTRADFGKEPNYLGQLCMPLSQPKHWHMVALVVFVVQGTFRFTKNPHTQHQCKSTNRYMLYCVKPTVSIVCFDCFNWRTHCLGTLVICVCLTSWNQSFLLVFGWAVWMTMIRV